MLGWVLWPTDDRFPSPPAGAIVVNDGVSLLETDEGGAVFLFGMASWCFEPDDVVGRRLAAVQLVETGAANPTEVAAAFAIEFETLRRWRHRWREAGVTGLSPKRSGPKGPSKLSEEVVAEIARLDADGLGLRAIARTVGLDPSTVRRGLNGTGSSRTSATPAGASVPVVRQGDELVPLTKPAPRQADRVLARWGLLRGAQPMICVGSDQPNAGALLVVPTLVSTGLLDGFEEVFDLDRAAFYSVRALVLTFVFCLVLGEARVEGLTRIDPVDLGRLIGLDRAPEVKSMRRRMDELAALDKSDELFARLAKTHLDVAHDACGLFYVDGHVRAYYGAANLSKAHIARVRIAGPAELDTWICDANGEGVLCWTTTPGASLVGELERATTEIRGLLGPHARPTIVFDRGGYSPRLFAELDEAGFDMLTYNKAPITPEEQDAFTIHEMTDDLGRLQRYELAEHMIELTYKRGKVERTFTCRQVTRLDRKSSHQSQILTTRRDLSAAEVAYAMFSRWRQENFFRYLRLNYGLDAMDSYAKKPDDLDRNIPNPAKRAAAATVRNAKSAVRDAEAVVTRVTLEQGSSGLRGLDHADDELEVAIATRRATPTRVTLGTLHPDAERLDGERKRLHDAIRMATYNATSSLARLMHPHYRRAEDEARMVIREALTSPADLEVVGDELHVRINPLSAPRRSRAIARICAELNATETLYPGTNLRLVYSVKGF